MKLRDDAVLPSRAHSGDAGFDLSACEEVTIGVGERATVGTGLASRSRTGHAGLVVPRSGLALRHGISMVNAPGVIDAGYRGEVRMILLNTDQRERVHRRAGHAHRAARRRAGCRCRASSRRDEVTATDRGEGGFGSSGADR